MPRFFLPSPAEDEVTLTGPDASHIARSLRMAPGNVITLCDSEKMDCHGVLVSVSPDRVTVRIDRKSPNQAEPTVFLRLYQCLPKGDKFEWIVQKAVELGVSDIVPVLSARCVSRPEREAMSRRVSRANRIAREAAGQSGRGIIPTVHPCLPFERALDHMTQQGLPLMFYEGGGEPVRTLVAPDQANISLLCGSEGGFEPGEVQRAEAAGVRCATLGPRILRAETAPLCALSALLYATNNL